MPADAIAILKISIHAPREGGDATLSACAQFSAAFQSTPPARGATIPLRYAALRRLHISIHAPREGGDPNVRVHIRVQSISIHAPREGGDDYYPLLEKLKIISIHAPREGGDHSAEVGARRINRFQSTPPARGATIFCAGRFSGMIFQSTPPARGATLGAAALMTAATFQSTPPARGATTRPKPYRDSPYISIHAPREGGDAGGRGLK